MKAALLASFNKDKPNRAIAIAGDRYPMVDDLCNAEAWKSAFEVNE
ncbi:hypothetical protein ABIA06_003190 [Bradyrhizobium yuanmingense]